MVWVSQTPHPSHRTTDDGWGVGNPFVPKTVSVRPYRDQNVDSDSEGGQDDDDILGFPGDGFVDKTDANSGVLGEQDEKGDDTRMEESGGPS
jgi:hypothetical protein